MVEELPFHLLPDWEGNTRSIKLLNETEVILWETYKGEVATIDAIQIIAEILDTGEIVTIPLSSFITGAQCRLPCDEVSVWDQIVILKSQAGVYGYRDLTGIEEIITRPSSRPESLDTLLEAPNVGSDDERAEPNAPTVPSARSDEAKSTEWRPPPIPKRASHIPEDSVTNPSYRLPIDFLLYEQHDLISKEVLIPLTRFYSSYRHLNNDFFGVFAQAFVENTYRLRRFTTVYSPREFFMENSALGVPYDVLDQADGISQAATNVISSMGDIVQLLAYHVTNTLNQLVQPYLQQGFDPLVEAICQFLRCRVYFVIVPEGGKKVFRYCENRHEEYPMIIHALAIHSKQTYYILYPQESDALDGVYYLNQQTDPQMPAELGFPFFGLHQKKGKSSPEKTAAYKEQLETLANVQSNILNKISDILATKYEPIQLLQYRQGIDEKWISNKGLYCTLPNSKVRRPPTPSFGSCFFCLKNPLSERARSTPACSHFLCVECLQMILSTHTQNKIIQTESETQASGNLMCVYPECREHMDLRMSAQAAFEENEFISYLYQADERRGYVSCNKCGTRVELTDQIRLECHHTFCQKCLRSPEVKDACPVCSAPTQTLLQIWGPLIQCAGCWNPKREFADFTAAQCPEAVNHGKLCKECIGCMNICAVCESKYPENLLELLALEGIVLALPCMKCEQIKDTSEFPVAKCQSGCNICKTCIIDFTKECHAKKKDKVCQKCLSLQPQNLILELELANLPKMCWECLRPEEEAEFPKNRCNSDCTICKQCLLDFAEKIFENNSTDVQCKGCKLGLPNKLFDELDLIGRVREITGEQPQVCIWADEKYRDEMYTPENCEHALCKKCLIDYIDNCVKNRQFTSEGIKCMTHECPEMLGYVMIDYVLGKHLDPKEYDKYIKFLLEAQNSLIPCPGQGCEYLYQIDVEESKDEDQPFLTCQNKLCETQICLKCFNQHHPNMTWEERIQENIAENTRELIAAGKRLGQCPRCKTIVEKDEACDHMVCYKCKTHYCFLCACYREPTIAHGNAWHRPNWKHWAGDYPAENDEMEDDCKKCQKLGRLCARPENTPYPGLFFDPGVPPPQD